MCIETGLNKKQMKAISTKNLRGGLAGSHKALLAVLLLATLSGTDAFAAFLRMGFNNPDAVVDAGYGIWAQPMVMDFDGDGDLDLVASYPDVPNNATVFFENPTRKGARDADPVFRAPVVVGAARGNATVSKVGGDWLVTAENAMYPDFRKTAFQRPAAFRNAGGNPIPANIHKCGVRDNCWRFADYDGDGRRDLIVGAGCWCNYGWHDKFDADGNWCAPRVTSYLYWLRNLSGEGTETRYADPILLTHPDGSRLETEGAPDPMLCDWDGDGDLDLMTGEFVDGVHYFENVGTRGKPVWAARRDAVTPDGKPFRIEGVMLRAVAADWNGDGLPDLVMGQEDGRLSWAEFTGRFIDGSPVFKPQRYFRQQAGNLVFGCLSTPHGTDWDGDGDWDLICGCAAGYVAFIENLSGKGVAKPKWAPPKLLTVGGKPIHIQAGLKGSIQGPVERKWGYTTVTTGDWDGDGFEDLVLNSITGEVLWYRNAGKRGGTAFEPARPVEVEWEGEQPRLAWGWRKPSGKALLTQWRTTPVVFDWNGDGLPDLVMLDHEGYLVLYERAIRDGKRVLLAPKRVFRHAVGGKAPASHFAGPLAAGQDAKAGEPIRLNTGTAGGSGRVKLCIVDWNGDGRMDFVTNGKNARVWLQVGAEDGKWTFVCAGDVDSTALAGHTTSPTAVDFDDDGVPELVIGAEDGQFYHKSAPGK